MRPGKTLFRPQVCEQGECAAACIPFSEMHAFQRERVEFLDTLEPPRSFFRKLRGGYQMRKRGIVYLLSLMASCIIPTLGTIPREQMHSISTRPPLGSAAT